MLAKKEQTIFVKRILSLLEIIQRFLSTSLTNTTSFGAYLEPIIQLIKPQWRHGRICARVVMLTNENNNTYTLTLKPDRAWRNFIAGQFVHLSCEKEGAMLTRTFSLSCSPQYFALSGEITLTIRQQDKGLLTPWLAEHLKAGDTVYISQAQGEFCLSSSKREKVFIAGGSGLTPIFSMLSSAQDNDWFKNTSLLFYTNNEKSRFFMEKLSYLTNKGLKLTALETKQTGRITREHIESLIESPLDKEYYICGPGEMITTSQSILQEMGISADQMHTEFFGNTAIAMPRLSLENDSDEIIQVDYLDSKKQSTYSPADFLGTSTSTLLEIAEQEGLKPVSGCRMGVCHQCICKKKTGRVYNTRTQEYSDTGEEEIQLCVSVPLGRVELEL